MSPCCSQGAVASSNGCLYHSQLQEQKGEEWDNQAQAGMGSWNGMSWWRGRMKGDGLAPQDQSPHLK